MREHGGKIPLGILRTVVPAAPDAWITALRDCGTMTFGDVAAPRSASPERASPCSSTWRRSITQYEDGYAVAVERGDLPARRPGAEDRRPLPADRSRAHAAIHGRSGARGRQARPAAGLPRRAPRSTAATSPRRSSRYHAERRRLSRRGRPRRLPQPLRAGQGPLARISRSTPAGRGARARCWRRRCA